MNYISIIQINIYSTVYLNRYNNIYKHTFNSMFHINNSGFPIFNIDMNTNQCTFHANKYIVFISM